MSACTTTLSAVPPCAVISAVAVSIFALAGAKKNYKIKNQNQNQKMNNLAKSTIISAVCESLRKKCEGDFITIVITSSYCFVGHAYM